VPKSTAYRGYDVHQYTPLVETRITPYWEKLQQHYGPALTEEQWHRLVTAWKTQYGTNPGILNLERVYHDGWIRDPQVPRVNFAVVAAGCWALVQDSVSLREHFGQTLTTIGSTCIQGVSHRLFWDYAMLADAEAASRYESWGEETFLQVDSDPNLIVQAILAKVTQADPTLAAHLVEQCQPLDVTDQPRRMLRLARPVLDPAYKNKT